MTNYETGVRKERKIVNEARKIGMIAFRSAGSHSPIDVCAIDKLRRQIYFVQCKPDSMSNKARARLEEELKDLNDRYEVHFEVR